MQNYILKMKYQRNLEKYFEVIDTEDTAIAYFVALT